MDENHKPTGLVNDQPVQPATPMSSRQLQELSTPKSSKWRYLFIILGILQLLGVGLFFLTMTNIAGKTGSEFIAIALYLTLVPAVGVVAVINFVGLLIYVIKRKLRGKSLIFSILSLLISAALGLYAAYSYYQLRVVAPRHFDELSEQSRQKFQEQDRQFAAANAKPEIAKAEATELLKTCQLKGFYYTAQNEPENLQTVQFPSAEASSTGIVLVKVDGKPYRISIADRLIPELVPIAREAQKTCRYPQFWHDGRYEHYKDGKWYFGSEVVNSVQSGKAKEEALAFMRSCKADYFAGQTDKVGDVDQESVRGWLKAAEQSSTGIEISENNRSHSYVFASKAMTTELLNEARQFRQSCSDKKKLQITIDDQAEVEYPPGTWSWVKVSGE